MRNGITAVGVLLICMLSASGLQAVEFRTGDTVTIAADEVIADDLYVTGETIVVDGVVEGDLVAVGRHVVLNGSALGDVIAAGQGIVINGQVGDDVRMAGMALRLGETATVADDVIAAGFSFEMAPGSVAAGSLLVTGFQALVAGEVGERLLGELGGLRIEGTVHGGGEVKVEAGEEPPPFLQFIPTPVPLPTLPIGLTFGDEARLGEELVYTSPAPASAGRDIAANLTHIASTPGQAETAKGSGWGAKLKRAAATLVVGLLALLVVPGWLAARAAYLGDRLLASLGWGVAGVLLTPFVLLIGTVALIALVVILAAVGLGGVAMPMLAGGLLTEGGLVVALWWSLALVGPIIVAFWLGKRLTARGGERGRFVTYLVGWLLLALVGLVPFLGGLVGLGVAVLGLGTIVAWCAGGLFGAGRSETAA